jgi:hypothetical protein
MHMKTKPTVPKNVRRFRAPCTVAIAAIAGTMLISACGSSKSSTTPPKTHLNTNRVALSIEQSILKQRHLHATVTCPAVVPQEPGRNFVCIATTRKGVKTSFAVTQSNNGNVTYQGL